MEQFITAGKGYTIYESDDAVLYELAEFVVRQNYRHHSGLNSVIPREEVEHVYNEEKGLINQSRILIARNEYGKNDRINKDNPMGQNVKIAIRGTVWS